MTNMIQHIISFSSSLFGGESLCGSMFREGRPSSEPIYCSGDIEV